VLEIEDHGTGFLRDAAGRGVGLVAMQERAEMVNGQIEFLRPPEGGTLVRLTVGRG
jgi:signal transduction histidine kinase